MMPTVVSISWDERPAWIFVICGPAARIRYGSNKMTFDGRSAPGWLPSCSTFAIPRANLRPSSGVRSPSSVLMTSDALLICPSQ